MVSLHHLIDAFFASEWRGFAIGFFTAGGMARLGRRFPSALGRFLAAGSAASGTLAGWLALLARDLTSGGGLAARLLVVAAAAALIGAVPPARAGKTGRNGGAPAAAAFPPAWLLGLALVLGAWWLGGAGRSLAAVIGAWRGEGVVLIAAGLTGIPPLVLLRATSAPVHWPLVAAAASLAAALAAIGVGGRMAGLALALAGAALGAGIGAGRAGDSRRGAAAMTAMLALLAGAAILADGPVAHGAVHARLAPVLMIPLGPLATLWLAQRLTRRFSGPLARRLGGVALAHLFAFAVTSLLGFSLAALAGLR